MLQTITYKWLYIVIIGCIGFCIAMYVFLLRKISSEIVVYEIELGHRKVYSQLFLTQLLCTYQNKSINTVNVSYESYIYKRVQS